MGAFEDLIDQAGGSESDKKKKSFEELVEQGSQLRRQEELGKVDSDYINSFFDSTSRFMEGLQKDYESAGWENAADIYRKNQIYLDTLNQQRELIESWMVAYRDQIGEDSYKALAKQLGEYSTATWNGMRALSGAKDFYDPDKNQDAYLAYVDRQNKLSYDLTAGQQKIDDLNRAILLRKEMDVIGPDAPAYIRSEYYNILDAYGLKEDDDLDDLITSETVMLNQSKWLQKESELASVVDSADFKEYSDMGAAIENPSYSDANGWGYLFGWRPGSDPIKNKVTFARDNADALLNERTTANGNVTVPSVVDPIYRHMTDDEVAIYNYYLAKEGEEKAEEYLKSIQDSLNRREAGEEYGRIQGNTALEMLYGATVGVDQFRSGMNGLISSFKGEDDYIPPSAIQYAGQAARQDLADNGPKIFGSSLGQIGYDALSTTANMAPSILASIAVGAVSKTAGTVVGNALLGGSAAGNAYQEKLNLGYSKEQARSYGLMVGASEIVMEKLLGGISALGGGTLSKMALSNLDKVDNVLARVAKSTGGKILMNAGSEALEEGLQSILEPYLWQAVSGEEASVDWQEALYSSLLGFVTGGIVEGANASFETVALNNATKQKYGAVQGDIVTEALEIDPNSKFAQRMQSRLDSGKDLSGAQINKLFKANESGMVKNDIAAIQKAAETALTNYGETGDVKVISEALAKQAAGKFLTRTEKAAISDSKYGQRVANELNPENIQSGDYNTAWAESIGTERINAEEYSRLVQDAETEAPDHGVATEIANVDSTLAEVSELKSEIEELTAASQNPSLTMGQRLDVAQRLEEAERQLKAMESGAEAQGGSKKVKVAPKVAVTIEEVSKKYGAQAKAMVATYNQGQNVRMFDSAYSVAYEMGKTSSVLLDDALNSEATQYLTPEQREHAFNAGRSAAVARDNARDQRAKAGRKGKKKGTVSAQGVKMADLRKSFNDPQNKAYKSLVRIAEATGINIVLIKSEVDAQGRYVGDNGKFQWKYDTIFIDINAGLDYASDTGELAKYSMLRTFSHEFTHFIEKNAPKEYSALRDLVFAEMKARGENVNDMIMDKQTKYKNLSYEAASREVIADAMSDILRDSSFVEKLVQKNQPLAQKILSKLKEFLADIKAYFDKMAENPHLEAKAIQQEMDGAVKYLESIIEAFDTAAVAAVENYQGISEEVVSELTPGQEGVVVDKDGEPVAYSTEDGTVMLSIRTYEEEGRTEFKKYLDKCVKNQSLTEEEMQEMLDGIEEIYTVCKEFKDKYAPFSAWSDAEVIRDTRGKPVFSVVTPNGEYKMNLDFSLVCKKRRTLDAVFNEMSKRGIIDDFELGKKTVVKINELIRKYGFETACSLCFVDAKRFRQADVADSVVRLYNELVQSLVPEEYGGSIEHFNFAGYNTYTAVADGIHTWPNSKLDFSHINEVLKQYGKNTVEAKAARYIKNHPEARKLLLRGDFMSSGGFDAVKSQNQSIMKIYNSKKGTGGPKAAFGDVQYMNEIISKKTWTPEKAYDVGGVRIQSFSDYVPRMVFDYVQMMYDLAATKLPAHAYTKEALFVKQFGLTGVKINMSLIPAVVKGGIAPGLDANGNYAWAGESFDFETAKAIQKTPGYSENCGTICVGVSYEHILKLLRDPDIRMVIPYHKSGLNPIVAHMNNIAEFTDYTSLNTNPGGCQSTMDKNGAKVTKEFDFSKTLHDMGAEADPKAVAKQYLDWCAKNEYTPKFAEFAKEENYYKMLTDFTVYDESGTYVPQREIRAVFPKEGDTFGSMKDLIQKGLDEDAIIEGRRDSKMSEMVDEIERTIPRTEAEISDDEQVEQADHDVEAELMDEERVQKQARNHEDDYAPTFYSQMEKVVSGMKQDKFGASSVVDMLRGRGVKAEEIKWSGIEAWLEGKKSVTKAELQEFIAGSMLQIEEDVLGDTEIPYSQEHLAQIAKYESERDIIVEQLKHEWKRIVGTDIPINYFGAGLESAVVNNLILVNKGKKDNTEVGYQHRAKRAALERVIEDSDDNFGFDNARQAFREAVKDPKGFMKAYELTAFEESVFKDFIKAKEAYGKVEGISIDDMKALKAIAESADRFSNRIVDVKNKHRNEAAKYLSKYRFYTVKGGTNYRELLFRIPESNYSNGAMYAHWERFGVLAHARIQDFDTFLGKMLFVEEIQSDWHNEGRKTGYEGVPDAPFRDNYHEFVLKRLIRMAAEQGYDSIGWTPAEIQSERWSDEFTEGYRIEYDQDIPKFLNKYGKKWGTKVGKTVLDSGTEVWSMAITDDMRDSVLYEGQAQYQKRTNTLTDHEILDMAAKELDTSKLTDGEKAALEIFRKKNDALKALKDERQKQGALYYQYQFGDQKDAKKATAARNRMTVLDTKITKASAEVLGIEDKKVLKDVLQKSRKVIEQHERKASVERVRVAREEARAKERRIANEKLEALRQKKNAQIAEVQSEERDKATERVQKVREDYQSSRLRDKIKAFKAKLEKNLLNPTERQYVPAGLTQAMIDVVNLIDIDTDLINEDGTVNKAQERRNETKMKLSDLAAEYERLKASDPVYAGEFDEAVYNYLTELRDNFADRHLKEMTFSELTEMYEILRSIEETLQDARKLIGWGDAETVYEAGDSIIAEQASITAKRKDGKRTWKQEKRDNTLALTLSPVRYVERMSGYHQSSYLLRLFKAFERGVRKKNMFKMEAYKSFEVLTSRQQYEDAMYTPAGKTYSDANGRSFRLSKMQMMQSILSLEREQANKMSHIEGSGFSFADLDMLQKGRLKDAISEEYSHRVPNAVAMVGDFVDLLKNDKWAQDYMSAARKFFNETAKDAINETSLALKHRIVAKDKSYIPFEVDKNFIVNEISAANDVQQTINSYGMLKDTKKFASNPLIITGLNNILDRHIEQVGNIYGLAIEVRNFNKVWNVRGLEADSGDPTVKATIQRNWGDKGLKLVEQAVQDIQGPRHNSQSAIYKKIKSGYIGATFLLNLSVVTKQIGSLFSATSMLRWRGPVRQIVNLIYTMTHSKKLSAEVDKYTASAWMRRQGLSDAEVYTLMTEGKRTWMGRLANKAPTAVNPAKWITAMDHAVALSLWKYAKQDTAKRTGLKGEDLLKATAEFYDELIENTQSMTDVLHRPEIQKRSDVISESFGMFKTDLYQMAGQLLATGERFHANKTKENGKALARTAYAVTMSAVWAQLMTAVFALLRYKVDQYRDDEDKDLTFESWMKRQGFSLAGDLVGYIFPMLGSELVGVAENIIYGESDELVDSLGLTAINNTYDAIINVFAPLADGELPKTTDLRKLTTNVLQMFGVPANNILRTLDAIQLHAKDIANGEFLSFEAGVERSSSHHAHRIMEAVQKGDMNLANALFDEAVEEAALKKSEDDSISDQALKDAKSALQTAFGKKFKEGKFSTEVAGKILIDLFGKSENDAYWTIKKWETGQTSEYAGVLDAVLSGTGFNDAVKEMTDHGYEKDDILDRIKSQVKTWYTAEESEVRISKQEATEMLRKYVGMKPDEVTATINKWSCKVVTGIAYDDIKDEFLAGNMTASRAIDMIVRYGGATKDESRAKVDGWCFEKKYGFAYSDRKDAYINGEITATKLRQAMITYGRMTADEADEDIAAYDWLKRNPKHDLSVSDVKAYIKPIEDIGKSIEQAGIKPDVYMRYKNLRSKCEGVDEDGDGKADKDTVKAEILEVIDSLPISAAQKDALYNLNGWAKSKIGEAPWH